MAQDLLDVVTYQTWLYFDRTLPTKPDQGNGRRFALETHGSTVYMTGRERFLLVSVEALAVAAFFLATAVELTQHPFRRN